MRRSPHVMLDLCDAAKRLGLSQKALDAMIAAGQVDACEARFCASSRCEKSRGSSDLTRWSDPVEGSHVARDSPVDGLLTVAELLQ
jgi:hypothetical protein